MVQFCIGVAVGGLIGFLICAVFSVNKPGKDCKQPPVNIGKGDTDACD